MKNVVIIGAGYTGLSAAYKLTKMGHKVTILERGTIIGGLASGFTIEDGSLERAYHHIFKSDTHIINLAEELGVKDEIVWHDSSVALYYDNKLYPFKGALDLIKFKPLNLINRIRAGLVVLYLQKTNKWQRLQNATAYNWMLKAAGKQVTEVIWEPLLKGKFDKYFNKVSMAWLWARIHVRAQSRERGGEKLGYFTGGFQVFTNALVNKLRELDVNIKTGVEIKSISNNNSNKVLVSFSDGSTEIYDSCIATIPSHTFSSLIERNVSVSKDYIKKLNSINYLGARLLVFSSTQEISPYYWHNINDLSIPFLVFINHTKLVDKKYYGNTYVYYLAAYLDHSDELFTCDDKKLEKLWMRNLKKIFPDFDKTKIRERHYFRFANAQHIVDNDYVSKIPDVKTPLKNVYLSNFSQIYPEDRGTNYAVREGIRVAGLI